MTSYGYIFLNQKIGFSIPCFFKKMTNYYCPGCGITRMFFSILRFDFYQAFRYNPLVFLYLIGYLLYLIIRKFTKFEFSNKLSYILLIIAILFGVLRNIEVFSFLQPVVV